MDTDAQRMLSPVRAVVPLFALTLIGLAAVFASRASFAESDGILSNCSLFPCLHDTCSGEAEQKEDEPKCDFGPCPCQERKTLMQWSYGTSFSGGPPSLDEPLESDRPGFTESPVTVGRGVVQLESGYTFTQDGHGNELLTSNAFPDTLWRIGMFAQWFEWRIEYNYEIVNDTISSGSLPPVHRRFSGSDDLLVGFKLALTPQEGILPQMGLNPEMSVPSGSPAFTAGEVMPAVLWLYNWNITKNIVLEGLTGVDRAADDSGNIFTEFSQAWNLQFQLTKKLQGYVEWYVIAPNGRTTERTMHTIDGGFSYMVTNNFQLDIETGVGLNEAADDFFAGSGAVVRF